jgi:Zn-dependent peptidase ImmA (M78 family)
MTIAQIHTQAEEYARQFNPDNIAPFPYQNILEAHPGLEVLFTELDEDNISGATFFQDDRFTILVNTTKPETRQHFTLGHELGHYFLHQDALHSKSGIVDEDATLDGATMLYRVDDETETRLEREANNFAAGLLMRADLVRRAWRVTESIEECAQIFQVSVVAMSIRLTQLGLVS